MTDAAVIRAELEVALAHAVDLDAQLEDAIDSIEEVNPWNPEVESLRVLREENRDQLGFMRVRLLQLDSGILGDFLDPQPQEGTMPPRPTIGRIVIYRSRTGNYDVPAMVTATQETLYPAGVELYEESGHEKGVPPLSSPDHVHLTVLTPGLPGFDIGEADFEVAREHGPKSGIINFAGSYQEWDIPLEGADGQSYAREIDGEPVTMPAPGTWRWPERV